MPKHCFKTGLGRADRLQFQTNARIYFVSEMHMKTTSPNPQIHSALFPKRILFSFSLNVGGHASPTGALAGDADSARGRQRLRTSGEQGRQL